MQLRRLKTDIRRAEAAAGSRLLRDRRAFNRLLAGARRSSARRRLVPVEVGLRPGDVVVMRGDPRHSSDAVRGNRMVALFFYHRKRKRRRGGQDPPRLQTHSGVLSRAACREAVDSILENFDFAKSAEDFGAKPWNNITNYTAARSAQKAGKLNRDLEPVLDDLRERVCESLRAAGVPVRDYDLVESFVNFYNKRSTRSGIGQHQDGTDMSIVVQLLNTGVFRATVQG